MKKDTKQRLIAIFIGAVMLASVAEVALLRTTPSGQQQIQIPDVLDRKLTFDELRSALVTGRAVIEYFHNESCITCVERENLYREFAGVINSGGSYVILSYGVYNETSDWMIDLAGNQINLDGFNSTADLKKMFCSSDIVTQKPNVCLLEEL